MGIHCEQQKNDQIDSPRPRHSSGAAQHDRHALAQRRPRAGSGGIPHLRTTRRERHGVQRHSGCPLQSRGSPGGISNYDAIILTNTIVADNANANCFNEGALHSAGHNLDGGDTCGFGSTGDLTDTDPGLGPL